MHVLQRVRAYPECEDRREKGEGGGDGCCTQKAGVTDTGGAVPREGKAMLHPVPRALPPRWAASPGSGLAPKVDRAGVVKRWGVCACASPARRPQTCGHYHGKRGSTASCAHLFSRHDAACRRTPAPRPPRARCLRHALEARRRVVRICARRRHVLVVAVAWPGFAEAGVT